MFWAGMAEASLGAWGTHNMIVAFDSKITVDKNLSGQFNKRMYKKKKKNTSECV